MGMELLSSIGINVISSIVYDIGKLFINNNKKALTEKQILEIISTFQDDINHIFERLDEIDKQVTCIQKQNEVVFKLLLLIFDNKSNISISYLDDGYVIDGNYNLNSLNTVAKNQLNHYAQSLPAASPKCLSDAIWPIPHSVKGDLLDEIENNLY